MKKQLAVTAALAASVCLTLGGATTALADDTDTTGGNGKQFAGALNHEPDAIADGVTIAEARAATAGDPAKRAQLEELLAALPEGWVQHRNKVVDRIGLEHSDWTAAVSGVINPNDYECDASPFNQWVDAEVEKIGQADLFVLSLLGVLDYATYDALLFQTDANEQYFGRHGEYKNALSRQMSKQQDFWDIKSFDIQLLAMHGNMLQDVDRVTRMVEVLLGAEGEEAAKTAKTVIDILEANPALDDGEHPLFTLNAFAFTAEGDDDPMVKGLPDKIVMGDGILEAMTEIGLDQTAGRAVLSHEFGHHVQYEDGLFDNTDLTGPEATRRTELMADAFGTFFLVHKKGGAANHSTYLKAQRLSYEVGDCSFDSNGHHGTPNQRMKAAKWGYQQVQKLASPNRITASKKLAARFDKSLPKLVAPDA